MMCAKLARCVHDPNICLLLGERFFFLFFDQCGELYKKMKPTHIYISIYIYIYRDIYIYIYKYIKGVVFLI